MSFYNNGAPDKNIKGSRHKRDKHGYFIPQTARAFICFNLGSHSSGSCWVPSVPARPCHRDWRHREELSPCSKSFCNRGRLTPKHQCTQAPEASAGVGKASLTHGPHPWVSREVRGCLGITAHRPLILYMPTYIHTHSSTCTYQTTGSCYVTPVSPTFLGGWEGDKPGTAVTELVLSENFLGYRVLPRLQMILV